MCQNPISAKKYICLTGATNDNMVQKNMPEAYITVLILAQNQQKS